MICTEVYPLHFFCGILSVETYRLTDKLHFESQLFQELVLHNRDHKKTWKSNEQESLFYCSLYA